MPARAAFDEKLPRYKQQIPPLFWQNALIIASNSRDKAGKTPVSDKQKLSEVLPYALNAATEFCTARQVELAAIESLKSGSLERLHQLSDGERAKGKKVAHDLLTRLKELLALSWRQKSCARSPLKIAIEAVLDAGLPRAHARELCQQKCDALSEHVYECCPERDQNVDADTEAG